MALSCILFFKFVCSFGNICNMVWANCLLQGAKAPPQAQLFLSKVFWSWEAMLARHCFPFLRRFVFFFFGLCSAEGFSKDPITTTLRLCTRSRSWQKAGLLWLHFENRCRCYLITVVTLVISMNCHPFCKARERQREKQLVPEESSTCQGNAVLIESNLRSFKSLRVPGLFLWQGLSERSLGGSKKGARTELKFFWIR